MSTQPSAHRRIESALMKHLTERGYAPTTVWAVGLTIFVTMASEAMAREMVEIFRLVSWVKGVRLMQDDPEDGGGFYAEVSI